MNHYGSTKSRYADNLLDELVASTTETVTSFNQTQNDNELSR